ncbi:MAG: hypothetical protein HP024_02065, partial [Acholeplasmatales bacterium]|nr:hypothetical protein [Acholeplasmatales bacterium]
MEIETSSQKKAKIINKITRWQKKLTKLTNKKDKNYLDEYKISALKEKIALHQ